MLKIFHRISDLSFYELMDIYRETNLIDCKNNYHGLTTQEAMFYVESSFYHFLNDIFFGSNNSAYYVWIDNGFYVSALRLETYKDGLLLTGLETHPEFRNRGYAKRLICEVISQIPTGTNVYAHIHRHNKASAAVHSACGFVKIHQYGDMIDGSTDPNMDTYFQCVE